MSCETKQDVILSRPPLVISDYEVFENKFGAVRLNNVRNHFGSLPTSSDIPMIKDLFVRWHTFDEILPIRCTYEVSNKNGSSSIEKELHIYKSIKRCNDVYIEAIKKKMSPLSEHEPKVFFESNWGDKKTNALKIVLEYDSTTYSLGEAWFYVGIDFNRFLANIKKHFGSSVHLRAWHSHKSGFPHIDVIIYFKNFEFSAVPWYDKKDNKLSFRIHPKQCVKHHGKYCKQAIKEAWQHGYVDIKCVQNMGGTFKEQLKYITHELDSELYPLTNAMAWYFRKQSFGISQGSKKCTICGHSCGLNCEKCKHCDGVEFKITSLGFVETIWGKDKNKNIDLAEPSDVDVINQLRSNSNRKLIAIEVFPIFPAYYFGKPCVTLFNYDKPPPFLSPNIENFLDNFILNKCDVGVTVRPDGVTVTTYKLREEEIV